MANKMEISDGSSITAPQNSKDNNDGSDRNQPNNTHMQEKIIKMHPLALIGISDHSTRVLSGGSGQPKDSVIMGLLFGMQNHLTISIIDAEEVEYKHNKQHVDTKIELHQKVFPTHEVVGWYRVYRNGTGGDEEEAGLPTPDDMTINNGWMKGYNESPLFVLMSSGEEDAASAEKDGMDVDAGADEPDAREKMDQDQQLPLNVYETLVASEQTGAIFVDLDFELETFEPERIAVEEVFKTQPATGPSVSLKPAAAKAADGRDQPDARDSENKGGVEVEVEEEEEDDARSASSLKIQSLTSSIEAMNARIAVLLEFLRKTQEGKIPPDHALLRQVESLVRQLPFVVGRGDFAVMGSRQMRDGRIAQEFEDGYDDMLVLSFLASMAKTTKAVLNYTEKFMVVNDNNKNRDRLRKLI